MELFKRFAFAYLILHAFIDLTLAVTAADRTQTRQRRIPAPLKSGVNSGHIFAR